MICSIISVRKIREKAQGDKMFVVNYSYAYELTLNYVPLRATSFVFIVRILIKK